MVYAVFRIYRSEVCEMSSGLLDQYQAAPHVATTTHPVAQYHPYSLHTVVTGGVPLPAGGGGSLSDGAGSD